MNANSLRRTSKVTRTLSAAAVMAATMAAVGSLSGCAAVSPDGGVASLSSLTQARLGRPVAAQRTDADRARAAEQVQAWLAEPLTADRCVDIALLNHPGLQSTLAALGVAEADRAQAARLANPTLGFGRIRGGGHTELDRSLTVSVLGLLALPAARDLGQSRFDEARLQAAQAVVQQATEARLAFHEAVAAQELLGYHQQVQTAADAASELARRMQEAGNFSRLAQWREQAFQSDARANLARARHQATATRERLARALGLAGDPARMTLPERLQPLPEAPAEPAAALRAALETRLDVQLARQQAQTAARALSWTRASRFVNVLELGTLQKNQTGDARQRGFDVSLELPLFDPGDARLARAEAEYQRALHQTAAAAAQAESDMREAHSAYQAAYAVAQHQWHEAVPLRKRISDEQLLRYNGMLISVFDLLADARDQIGTVTTAVQALRDYWLADAQLQAVAAGAPYRGAPVDAPTRPAAANTARH
ncbi:TolC family protein [Roseateles sp. BYS87W]|uniref:TolC family protein n=1 Tax=Pelomonas baiyunensis TaxID=3299026 RepID=A0ABW7GUQ0_9BURK